MLLYDVFKVLVMGAIIETETISLHGLCFGVKYVRILVEAREAQPSWVFFCDI